MPVGLADLHKAMHDAWDANNLDNQFYGHRATGADRTEYLALYEDEASPNCPFPYCIYKSSEGEVSTRMSAPVDTGRYEIRDIPWKFTVYARNTLNNAAKEVAASLAALIMAAFGGHPTEDPTVPEVENGCVLVVQFLREYGTRMGEDEHIWTIDYNLKLDVPVRG